MKKHLTRMHVCFTWKGTKIFRMRVATHAADQISGRKEFANETILSVVKRLAEKIENADLSTVPEPQLRDDFIFYFADTNEVLFTTFIPAKPSETRKVDIAWEMIAETYMFLPELRPVHTWSTNKWENKTVCIAIEKGEPAIVGCQKPYFCNRPERSEKHETYRAFEAD